MRGRYQVVRMLEMAPLGTANTAGKVIESALLLPISVVTLAEVALVLESGYQFPCKTGSSE